MLHFPCFFPVYKDVSFLESFSWKKLYFVYQKIQAIKTDLLHIWPSMHFHAASDDLIFHCGMGWPPCFRYGLECLFRFYSYGLEKKFRPEVYQDFQAETIADFENGK